MSKRNTITMSADRRGEVQIYDVISNSFWVDGVSAKGFSEALSDLGEVDILDVRFNTPGGDVFQGMAVYNALNRHPAKKIGHVDALAASMGSVILCACDEIEVAENAIVMIHNVQGGLRGEPDDLRAYADRMEKLNENAIDIYASRTGMNRDDVVTAMKAETWYTAKEALAAGFATKITPNKTIVACCDASQFTNVPDWASLRMEAQTPTPKKKGSPVAELTPEQIAKNEADIQAKATADAKAQIEAEAKAEADRKAELDVIRAEAVTAERERTTQISALCTLAGQPELAASFCEKADCQPADVQNELFAALCAKNKPVGDGGGSDEPSGSSVDAPFIAEYKAEPAYAIDMTQDQYVAMRRIDEGIDTLEIAN